MFAYTEKGFVESPRLDIVCLVVVPVVIAIGETSGSFCISVCCIVAVVELPAPNVLLANFLIPFHAFENQFLTSFQACPLGSILLIELLPQ